jgi:hypothetical protein
MQEFSADFVSAQPRLQRRIEIGCRRLFSIGTVLRSGITVSLAALVLALGDAPGVTDFPKLLPNGSPRDKYAAFWSKSRRAGRGRTGRGLDELQRLARGSQGLKA